MKKKDKDITEESVVVQNQNTETSEQVEAQIEEIVESVEDKTDAQVKKEVIEPAEDPSEGKIEKVLNGLLKIVKKVKSFKKTKPQVPFEEMGRVKRFFMKINEKPVIACVVMSVVSTIIIEALSRRNIMAAFQYIVDSPVMFIIDVLIILFTLFLALLFKKRLFCVSFVLIMWIGMGIVNYGLLSYRTTPFSMVDVKLLKSVGSIIEEYLGKAGVVIVYVVVIALIVGIVALWLRLPRMRDKISYPKSVAIVVVTLLATIGLNKLSLNLGLVNLDLGNIAYAYNQCGFSYCLTNSIFNVGIDKPYSYSEDKLNAIQEEIQGYDERASLTRPNIVFVQLESFYDVNRMKNYTYSENPVPNWDELRKNYSSGFMTVPSIGAGTANTEFEVMSGMSLDYFGFCEYPYKTILKDTNVESICYNLQELGYKSTAIHDNKGTFYSRNKVFPRLGYNDFISIEYMKNVTYNPLGWADDDVLIDEITKTMDTSEKQDFIYTITVQAHGKYPDEQVDDTQTITMEGESDPKVKNQYEYYINQVHQEDEFIKNLTDTLSAYDEDVVVVFYGDHLPTFDLSEDDLSAGSLYQTEYVIWSNFGLEEVDKDYSAYQIGAVVMGRLGFDNGILTKLHQNDINDADYQEKLELLQYDMLYGKKYVYDGTTPYPNTRIHMGLRGWEEYITSINDTGDKIYVHGGNYNPFSYVFINGKKHATTMVNETTLVIQGVELKEGDRIFVKQLAGGQTYPLSKSNEYIY